MKQNHFSLKSYAIADSHKIACLVLGYRDSISMYYSAAKTLNERGYSVVLYKVNPVVVDRGDPKGLLEVIDGLINDFTTRIKGHDEVICGGLSLGAGIAMCLQRAIPSVRYGIYAVAGVSPSESIFNMPLFTFARRKFIKNGYDADGLINIWRKHEILPEQPPRRDSPIVMVLGKRDRVVNYAAARATLLSWENSGVPIEIITLPRAGHLTSMRWFKRHIGEVITSAENLVSGSTQSHNEP